VYRPPLATSTRSSLQYPLTCFMVAVQTHTCTHNRKLQKMEFDPDNLLDTPSTVDLPYAVGGMVGSAWVWSLYMVTITCAIIFNGWQLYLLRTNAILKAKRFSDYILFQTGIDLFWNSFCLVQCALNFSVLGIYGGKPGCDFMAWQTGVFVSLMPTWMGVTGFATYVCTSIVLFIVAFKLVDCSSFFYRG
jgi:hypothetical protein